MSSRIAALLFVAVIGCSRSPHLAAGPIELGQLPVLIRFERPVHSPGPLWELCFEFDLPRDSHSAAEIHAVLLTSSAQRRVAAQSSGYFVAVQSGKADVHKHDVRPPLDRSRQSVWTGVGVLDAVTQVPQGATEHQYQVVAVINH